MLAGGEAELAFGLGDLEAGDPEAEGFQDVGLDLVVGGLCLGSGQVSVLQIEDHADGHVRIFSDQLNNRLHMARYVDFDVSGSARSRKQIRIVP